MIWRLTEGLPTDEKPKASPQPHHPRAEGAAIAEKRETNAERFARGMNPLPPARRAERTSE